MNFSFLSQSTAPLSLFTPEECLLAYEMARNENVFYDLREEAASRQFYVHTSFNGKT